MKDYYINALRLPSDLYEMIENECKRRESFHGYWPGIYPVILDALYAHFQAVESSYKMEDSEK